MASGAGSLHPVSLNTSEKSKKIKTQKNSEKNTEPAEKPPKKTKRKRNLPQKKNKPEEISLKSC